MTERPEPSSDPKSSSTGDSGIMQLRKLKLDSNQYQLLFVEGTLSDFTVEALGHVWELHKNILAAESSYFLSFFTKEWKETKDRKVRLQIPDVRVTYEALDACFQSMYSRKVEIESASVVSLLAGASFLQMDGLIRKCYDFMLETLDIETAIEYYYASSLYGGKEVEEAALEYVNVGTMRKGFLDGLDKIDADLMERIARSYDLFIKDETALYYLMVLWMYMKVTGSTFTGDKCWEIRLEKAVKHFEDLPGSAPFLQTEAGKPYARVFRWIRIRDVLLDTAFEPIDLERGKVLPKLSIDRAVAENWQRVIRAYGHSLEPIPQTDAFFAENCTRKGIYMIKIQSFSTSTTTICDFLMGLEIICKKIGDKWFISIKRTPGKLDVSSVEKRNLMARIKIFEVKDRKIIYSKSSAIEKASLKVGEEHQLLELVNNTNSGSKVFCSVNYLF